MIDYNYHTHTARCRHASGKEEEYILRAIDGGIKYMGFSDHVPFVFPDGYESYYRIEMENVQNYFDTLINLREKYKDKIEIKIGFEMEYYPKYFNEMVKLSKNFGAEYLLLGQHFLGNEHPLGTPATKRTDNKDILKEYTDDIIAGIESKLFTYVAHPDIINYFPDDEAYINETKRICITAKKHNLPLEINFLGIRAQRHYPREKFWEIAGEIGAPVTFGFDAHDVMSAFDCTSYKIAKNLVNKYNLNYVGKPKIIEIQ